MSGSLPSSPSSSVAAPLAGVSIKHILFPTDFSEPSMHALPYVAGLAAKFGASIHLCHFVMLNMLAGGAPEGAPFMYAATRNQGEEELAALAASEPLKMLRPKTVLVSGTVGQQLPALIRENHIDLIVAGTHGRTGVRRLLLGSVVEEICRVASCPVLTVGPALLVHDVLQFRRILFPTDLSEDSRKIVPHLCRVAHEFSSRVTVLHVLPEELETNPDAPDLAEPIRAKMSEMFDKKLCGFKAEYLIRFGNTAQTVLEIASESGFDLIAMGIRDAFLPEVQLRSSTVYKIMVGANCPVLTRR